MLCRTAAAVIGATLPALMNSASAGSLMRT